MRIKNIPIDIRKISSDSLGVTALNEVEGE
jgi:hypothetical protein